MNNLLLFVFFLSLLLYCNAFVLDDTVRLFVKSVPFDTAVATSPDVWAILFVSRTCPQSQVAVTEFNRLAHVLNGILHLGAVDMFRPVGNRIAKRYNVTRHPTLYVFAQPNQPAIPVNLYQNNQRIIDAETMAQSLLSILEQVIQQRLTALKKKNNTTTRSTDSSSTTTSSLGSTRLILLDETNFESEILQTTDSVSFVAFSSKWCGHCQDLLPEMEQAAQRLAAETGVKLGWMEGTATPQLLSAFRVYSYPTILYFPGVEDLDVKTPHHAKMYRGAHTAQSLVQFAYQELDRSGLPQQVLELTDAVVLEESCGMRHSRHFCILAALPPLADDGAVSRLQYQDVLEDIYRRFRGSLPTLSFVWFEGGSVQRELEEALGMSEPYPSVAALSISLQCYATLQGRFTKDAVVSFVQNLVDNCDEMTVPLAALPNIATVAPWDGQDDDMEEDSSSASDWSEDEL